MSVDYIKPDAAIFRQLAQDPDSFQKLLIMVVWKIQRSIVKPSFIRLTLADIQQFSEEVASGKAVLLTHAHVDSIDLKMVTMEEAKRLAEWDAKQKGRA